MLLLVGAVSNLLALGWVVAASGAPRPLPAELLVPVVWMLAPFAAAAAVVASARRHWPAGRGVATLGLVLAASTAVLIAVELRTDDTGWEGLALLFAPLVQWLVLGISAAAAAGMHRAASRPDQPSPWA